MFPHACPSHLGLAAFRTRGEPCPLTYSLCQRPHALSCLARAMLGRPRNNNTRLPQTRTTTTTTTWGIATHKLPSLSSGDAVPPTQQQHAASCHYDLLPTTPTPDWRYWAAHCHYDLLPTATTPEWRCRTAHATTTTHCKLTL